MGAGLEQICGAAITHNFPLAQQHAAADLRDDRLDLMGHQQQGGAAAGQVPQDGQEPFTVLLPKIRSQELAFTTG